MQHSSYHDDASLTNLFEAIVDVFSILGLNCQSLNAKIDQIIIKLQRFKVMLTKLVRFVYKKHGYQSIPTFPF